jgi:exosome complex RNA-binding protein Csl4
MSEFVVPGQRLGFIHDFKAGTGTYIRGNYIYASTVGAKKVFVEKGEEEKEVGFSRFIFYYCLFSSFKYLIYIL